MLPHALEYLALLSLAGLSGGALFYDEIKLLSRDPAFWWGGLLFECMSLAVDLVAVDQEWWSFGEGKSTGLTVVTIPVEEFMLFGLVYVWVLAVWVALRGSSR